jgi:hypothetical protein
MAEETHTLSRRAVLTGAGIIAGSGLLQAAPAGAIRSAEYTAVSARAQEPTGIISSTITDTSGAVVPNVTITITNKATGAARTAAANAEGLYSDAALFPADYEVRVEQAGFRTVVTAAQVVAGGATNLDLTVMP